MIDFFAKQINIKENPLRIYLLDVMKDQRTGDFFYLGPNEIKEITEILFAGEKHGEAIVHFFYFRTSKDIIEDVTLSAGE